METGNTSLIGSWNSMKTGNTSLKVAGLVWKLKYQSKGSWNSMKTGNTSLKVAGIVWKLEILV